MVSFTFKVAALRQYKIGIMVFRQNKKRKFRDIIPGEDAWGLYVCSHIDFLLIGMFASLIHV